MVHDLFSVRDDGSLVLSVHAQPGAGRSAVMGRHGDALKVRIAVPPEGGRANAALTKLLREELGAGPGAVELASGEHSREKRFRITGLEPEDLAKALERVLDAAGDGPGRPPRDRR